MEKNLPATGMNSALLRASYSYREARYAGKKDNECCKTRYQRGKVLLRPSRVNLWARRSAKHLIAIGLSKAGRAGIPLKAPSPKTTSAETREKAAQDTRRGKEHPVTCEEGSGKRGRASLKAMQREPKSSVSPTALSKQAKSTARKRGQKMHRKSA